MISKLRGKITFLFVTLTMLVFSVTQVSVIRRNIEDVWRNDLVKVDVIASRVMSECVEKGSIKATDLSEYVDMKSGQRYLISLSNGREENTNANLWGEEGKALEELARAGQASGPNMTGDFDDWEGLLTIYPVVGKHQSRTYVAKANFNENEMTIFSPGKSLWENIAFFSRLYAPNWVVTFAAVCLLSFFLVRIVLRPVAASIQSQRNFVAAASHELKAPMAVIQANAEALTDSNAEKKQRVILDECKRMTGLIHSLLALASSDSGKQNLYIQEVDVDTLMIEVWEAFEESARKKNIHLELGIDEHYPKLNCDSERIHQAIGILVDNAICYSPAGSSIFLGARVEKSKLIFSVIDHGSGIPDC